MELTNAELKAKLEFLESFRRDAYASMRIRVRIAKARTEAIARLSKDHNDPEGIALIAKCLKRDKKLMGIINRGLSRSRQQIEDINGWIRSNIKDKQIKNNSEALLNLIRVFYKYLPKIEKRIGKEERFMETRTKKSFDDFAGEWKKELKLNRKLLKKAAGLSTVNEFFAKTKALLQQGKLGLVGGAVGAGALTIFYKVASGEDFNEKMGLAFGATVALCAIGQTLAMMAYLEKEIEDMNMDMIKMVSSTHPKNGSD